jgi:hypothetical protein
MPNPGRLNVEFHPAAQDELNDAVTYYERARFGLGLELLAAVKKLIGQIRENPTQFSYVTRRARRAKVRRFPYGVVYTYANGCLSIKAIMHLHREPKYWKNRL